MAETHEYIDRYINAALLKRNDTLDKQNSEATRPQLYPLIASSVGVYSAKISNFPYKYSIQFT